MAQQQVTTSKFKKMLALKPVVLSSIAKMFVNLSELFLVWASVSRLWLSKHRKGGAGATIDVTVEVGAVDDIDCGQFESH